MVEEGKELEVEVKAKVTDIESFEKELLKKQDIIVQKDWHIQIDTYLRHPGRDFAKTDEALRVRQVEGRTILTYKGPKVDNFTKTREELEANVDGDILDILRRIGFDALRKVEKKRKVYLLGPIEICLDKVKELGTYIEIELKGKDLEGNRKKVMELAKDLGLKDLEIRSYLELILDKTN